ncbi:MAG: glycosyltransferase family 9 protein [Firmicutes bacterium]|nr:glycosyltransferase family 9 protein [Bacillota bacterium]
MPAARLHRRPWPLGREARRAPRPSSWIFRARPLPQPDQVRTLFVPVLCPLGDTLFATPALRALRRRFPRAEVTALAWASNAELLRGHPAVDRLWVAESPLDLAHWLVTCQEARFDLAVGLSNAGSWLAAFSGARWRTGFGAQSLGLFYNLPAPDRRDVHAVDYALAVARATGAEPEEEATPDVHPSPADRRWARRFERRFRRPGRPLVALHPGGRFFPQKRWPAASFARLARELEERRGARLVVVGGADDAAAGEEIVAALARREDGCNLAGRLGLLRTAALLARVDLFVGNDSSPLHLAAAVGTPTLALFGPTDPRNFAPRGERHRLLRAGLECSPCIHWMGGAREYLASRRYQEEAPAECMLRITPERVLAEAEAQLERWGLKG